MYYYYMYYMAIYMLPMCFVNKIVEEKTISIFFFHRHLNWSMEINIKKYKCPFLWIFYHFLNRSFGYIRYFTVDFCFEFSQSPWLIVLYFGFKKTPTNKSRAESNRATAVASRNFRIPTDQGIMIAINSRFKQQYDIAIAHQSVTFLS